MAKAYKCDRCRKLYENNEHQEILCLVSDYWKSQTRLDLCPECHNALLQFMDDGLFKTEVTDQCPN